MADVRLTATNPEDSSVVPVACNEKGELKLEEPLVVEGPPGEKGEKGEKGDKGDDGADGDPFSGSFEGNIDVDGSLKTTGSLVAGDFWELGNTLPGSWVNKKGYIRLHQSTGDTASYIVCRKDGSVMFRVKDDGSISFAQNKAGFTEAGVLWCTTERGDTIKLVGSSNGMGIWEDYTPSLREDIGWDKKNAIRPILEESSQDEPEMTQ